MYGDDGPKNMQLQLVEDAKAKDKWERLGSYLRDM